MNCELCFISGTPAAFVLRCGVMTFHLTSPGLWKGSHKTAK